MGDTHSSAIGATAPSLQRERHDRDPDVQRYETIRSAREWRGPTEEADRRTRQFAVVNLKVEPINRRALRVHRAIVRWRGAAPIHQCGAQRHREVHGARGPAGFFPSWDCASRSSTASSQRRLLRAPSTPRIARPSRGARRPRHGGAGANNGSDDDVPERVPREVLMTQESEGARSVSTIRTRRTVTVTSFIPETTPRYGLDFAPSPPVADESRFNSTTCPKHRRLPLTTPPKRLSTPVSSNLSQAVVMTPSPVARRTARPASHHLRRARLAPSLDLDDVGQLTNER